MKFLRVGRAILLSLGFLIGGYVVVAAADLGINSGFNNPFNDIPGREWREQPQKIADGWQPFYIEANTDPGSGDASKLRWMSSAQFAAAFGGGDYHIEGDQSQVLWTSYDFDGGVYQQISGVTPGQAYGFDIAMTTFWRGPGDPIVDGKMVKQVGIDPQGGTDATSESIVWSDPNAEDNEWFYLDVAAVAENSTITVFAKVQAPENDSPNHVDLNMVYFDAAHIDVAPTTAINASSSGTTVNANWVGVSAPGWSIKGFEVQYRDKDSADWITLQNKNQGNTNISFEGEGGHTYVIRVRPWQRKSESYNSDIDMPGVWTEAEVLAGEAVGGRIFNHGGIGLAGVTVSIEGANSVTSTSSGEYLLPTGGSGDFNIVASDFGDLAAPPPIAVTVAPNTITPLDITLRPSGDQQAITNNDFETDLTGWNVSDGAAAESSDSAAHTGLRSLRLSNTVAVSQTSVVTGMRYPLLSFWRKNDQPFTVELLAATIPPTVTAVTTKTLSQVDDWTFTTVDWHTEAYSGTLGVNFVYEGGAANIFIDEVSLAAGFRKIYLPVVLMDQ